VIDRDTGLLEIENARLVFLNFAGAEKQYNRPGDRNFCIILDEPIAQDLLREGWNVKRLRQRDPDSNEPGDAYLEVKVSFKGPRPPRILLITSRTRTPLTEELCELVDMVDIQTVDVIVRPYKWVVNGKTGIKAYLKTIYVTVQEDRFEHKYADLEELRPNERPALTAAEEQQVEYEIIEGEWRDS